MKRFKFPDYCMREMMRVLQITFVAENVHQVRLGCKQHLVVIEVPAAYAANFKVGNMVSMIIDPQGELL